MFQISDLPINKEEVALRLQLKAGRTTEESCVPSEKSAFQNTYMLELLPKLLQSLAAWGFFCCSCKKKSVKLYPLSAACDRWKLEVSCKGRTASVGNSSRYCFEIRVTEGSG